jgi:TRAP-type C4-dicarboxylate transport system permease small subunit
MHRLETLTDRVAQILALIGSLGVLAMLVHVGIDVAARNIFERPIPATNEIVSRYYMVLIAFLPLAWVERRRSMVSVELLDMALSPGAIRVSDVLVSLFSTLVYATIAWVTLLTAVQNWRIGAYVDVLGQQLPIWPSYFLPPAGFLLAALVTLMRAVNTLQRTA